MTVFFVPPVPGEYHYKVVGMWLWLDEFGSKGKVLKSTRNLMQNTLEFDVINPVDSQHDTCTCKGIWLTCGVRWVYLFISLSCRRVVAKQLPMFRFQHSACDIK